MPRSAKPRKKHMPKETKGFSRLFPHEKDKLGMPTHLCVLRASMGIADEEDFHTLAAALNVAFVVVTQRGNLPSTEALLAAGLDLLNGCNRNINNIQDIKHLAMAVNMADELNNHIKPEEMQHAVEIVLKNAEVVGAPNPEPTEPAVTCES